MHGGFLRVRDVMQTTIHRVDGMASVRTALAEMKEHRISSLVIERRQDGDEYGIVSIEKLADRVIARGKSLDRTSIYEVMDKPVLTVTPDMAVKYAIRLLARFDQRRALVVDSGKTAGLVTIRDMMLSYLQADEPARIAKE